MRSNKHDLVRLAEESEAPGEILARALEVLCTPLPLTWGVVLTIDEQVAR